VHLSLVDFCELVKQLDRTNAEKALAVLWYRDRKQADAAMTTGQLTKALVDHHVGTPNATQLAIAIRKTKLANESKRGFSLRPGSRRVIYGWLPNGIDGMQPAMDHSSGYLPEPVWIGTRGYIESVWNYFMLKHLVARANANAPHPGLNLGRDAKKNLEDVKALGDKSAHNRRFVANAADLMSIQGGVRTATQELIQIANLKRST
jgi:hypothetical protein